MLLEAELVEFEADALLVEDAHDHALAVHARDRDHADVDVTAVNRHPDAPVLRDAALGDVEVGHDLDARDNARDHLLGHGGCFGEHAVDAHPHAHLAGRPAGRVGLGLVVDVRGAAFGGLRDDRVHELDDRRVVGRLAEVDNLLVRRARRVLLDRLGDGVLEAVHAHDQRGDVLARGHGRADVKVRQERDVIDRQYVGRIGHRQQQRVLVDVGDGDSGVALGCGGAQQVGGRHVDLEDPEVEVIKPVTLGDCARELLGGDRLLVEQHPLGRNAGRAGRLEGPVDRLPVGEPKLDHDVGEMPA